MSLCKRCGKLIKANANFCDSCTAKIRTIQTHKGGKYYRKVIEKAKITNSKHSHYKMLKNLLAFGTHSGFKRWYKNKRWEGQVFE